MKLSRILGFSVPIDPAWNSQSSFFVDSPRAQQKHRPQPADALQEQRLTQDEEIIHTNTCKSTAPLTTKCGSTTPDEESSRPIAVVPTGRKTGAALRLAYASSSVSDLAVARSPNGSTTKRFQPGEALAAWIALRIAKTSKSVSSRAGSIKSEV